MVDAAACPSCDGALSSTPGWPTWCACGYGLTPVIQGPRTRLDRFAARLGDGVPRRVHDEIRKGSRRLARGGLILAYLIALMVGSLIVGMIAIGIWLIARQWPSPIPTVLGAVLVVVGVYAMPWPIILKRATPGRVDRAQAPTLWGLIDEVSATLRAPPPDGLLLDDEFNAWMSRRELGLGLPLLAVLDGQEIAALVGHEIGHRRAGDPTRSHLTGAAIETSYRLADAFSPPAASAPDDDPFGVALSTIVATAVGRFVALVVGAPGNLIALLAWPDHHRAEYAADLDAATVAGRPAAAGFLQTLTASPIVSSTLHRAQAAPGERYASLRGLFARMPPSERERQLRVAQLERSSLGASHPPTALRLRLTATLGDEPARIHVDAARERALRDELAPFEKLSEARIADAVRSRLYGL